MGDVGEVAEAQGDVGGGSIGSRGRVGGGRCGCFGAGGGLRAGGGFRAVRRFGTGRRFGAGRGGGGVVGRVVAAAGRGDYEESGGEQGKGESCGSHGRRR